jgi:hypothetical protein
MLVVVLKDSFTPLLIQVLQLLNHGLPQPHGVESLAVHSARSICFEDPGFDSDYSSSDYRDDLRRHKEIAMQFWLAKASHVHIKVPCWVWIPPQRVILLLISSGLLQCSARMSQHQMLADVLQFPSHILQHSYILHVSVHFISTFSQCIKRCYVYRQVGNMDFVQTCMYCFTDPRIKTLTP